jgi:hypothetical protein
MGDAVGVLLQHFEVDAAKVHRNSDDTSVYTDGPQFSIASMIIAKAANFQPQATSTKSTSPSTLQSPFLIGSQNYALGDKIR